MPSPIRTQVFSNTRASSNNRADRGSGERNDELEGLKQHSHHCSVSYLPYGIRGLIPAAFISATLQTIPPQELIWNLSALGTEFLAAWSWQDPPVHPGINRACRGNVHVRRRPYGCRPHSPNSLSLPPPCQQPTPECARRPMDGVEKSEKDETVPPLQIDPKWCV